MLDLGVDAHESSGLLSGERGSQWVLCGAMSEAHVASGLLSGASPWARLSAPRHRGVLTQAPMGTMAEHVLSPGQTQLWVCSASRILAWPSGAKVVHGFEEAFPDSICWSVKWA